MKPSHVTIRPAHRRGFSMMEVVMSTLIVGGMLVASLSTVAASRASMKTLDHQGRAALLGQDLMDEIMAKRYEEPSLPAGSFGLAADEAAAGNRSLYDDVDDYHGLDESPPRRADGSTISGSEGYRRIVWVGWVRPDDLVIVNYNTGVKGVIVWTARGEKTLSTLVALRSNASFDPAADQLYVAPDGTPLAAEGDPTTQTWNDGSGGGTADSEEPDGGLIGGLLGLLGGN